MHMENTKKLSEEAETSLLSFLGIAALMCRTMPRKTKYI